MSTTNTVKLTVNYEGENTYFVMNRKKPLVTLMKKFHQASGVDIGSPFRFIFDGNRLDGSETPEKLSMDDDDIIDVLIQQTGGNSGDNNNERDYSTYI